LGNTTVVAMSGEHYFSESPKSTHSTNFHEVALRSHTVTVTTASGTFSPGGVDRGTQVLLKYAPPPPPQGNFLDIGCGWGPLSLALALESPQAQVIGIEVNERARMSATENYENLGISNLTICHPDEVPPQSRFDLIWSNPPIRVGKVALYEIVTRWLNTLTAQGEAWFVIAKKLGGDSLHDWINQGKAGDFQATRVETSKGFRVLHITRL